MGACGSSPSNEEGEQKKRSQAIDRTLEEDSKKLRRECKILLLGGCQKLTSAKFSHLTLEHRFRRKRKEYYREADENHTPEWLHSGRACSVQAYDIQERH